MRKTYLWACIIVILSLFTLCKKDDSVISPSSHQINIPPPGEIKGKWEVIALEKFGQKVEYLNPLDTINLVFDDDSVLHGRSCGLCGNYYMGKYYIYAHNHVRLDSLASTEIACTSSFYWQFYHFLTEVNTFGMDTLLYLYNEPETQILWLKRSNTNDITNRAINPTKNARGFQKVL